MLELRDGILMQLEEHRNRLEQVLPVQGRAWGGGGRKLEPEDFEGHRRTADRPRGQEGLPTRPVFQPQDQAVTNSAQGMTK
jgi:hypothetical protein